MKHTALFTLIILLALAAAGCGPLIAGSGNIASETRPVTDFSQVDLMGVGEVILTQGDEESLRIEAEDNLIPYIDTLVQDGVLKIGFNLQPGDQPVNLQPTKPVKFYLTLKNVAGLQVSGSGSMTAGSLVGEHLELQITGSGNIRIDKLNVTALSSNISGSGDLRVDALQTATNETSISGSGTCELGGQTGSQSVRISGSGDYLAYDLQSQAAVFKLSGAGNAQAWVTGDLDVQISGSGRLQYYGDPRARQHVSGSGEVSALGTR